MSPIRRPRNRQSLTPETELYSVASLSETAHSQLLLTESVTQAREQTGNGQGRGPDGSRRRVGLEPTPTREQAELGRRTPHIYVCMYVCMYVCRYACKCAYM